MKTRSLEELKNIARALFAEALAAIDPTRRLRELVRIEKNRLIVRVDEGREEKEFDLAAYKSIFLVGTGKASSSMAQAIESILGDRITTGVITTKDGHLLPLEKTKIIEAGHPIPDERGLRGAKKIQGLLKRSGPKDLVLYILSGGGSALLPLPAQGIRLDEKQEASQLLLDCGADIREINTVRKHISQVKGGWLAKWASPSTVIGFILSDVVGDPLDVIASGPMVPDPSTFEDAWNILEKYDLVGEIASSISSRILLGKEGKLEETPKPGDPVFRNIHHVLIGSNRLALRSAEREAASLGFNPLVLSSSIVGDTRESARFHAAVIKEVVSNDRPVAKPACILSGGETTVTIRGKGLGGRNQEFALAAALEIDGMEKVVILSGGTDGTDGPTDAAGAVVDHTTLARAREAGLDARSYLRDNNSYPFFERLGDLLITGPTRTNVMDIRIILVN